VSTLQEHLLTSRPPRTRTRTRSTWLLVGLAVATFVVRLSYLTWPMTSDEGGYLQLVRQWSQGPSDYGQYFMDRPPVLVVWYQLVEALSGLLGTTGAMRTVGSLAAAITVLAVGLATRLVGGHRAGIAGAAVTGALLASPLMGSVATDGELLAAPFIGLGTWLALVATSSTGTPRSRHAAVLAGVCAALALLVKQNMLDVAVFSGVLALVAWRTGRLTFADVRSLALSFLSGAGGATVAVLAYAGAHGTSPSEVVYAMYGFRAQAVDTLAQVTSTYRAERLHDLGVRGLASGGFLVVALLWLVVQRRLAGGRTRRTPVEVAVLVLAVFVTVSVLAGGAFWSHYLVQYAVPIGLAAGLLVASVPQLDRMLVAPCVVVACFGWVLGTFWPPHSDSVRIGQAIGSVTAPGDTLVSALGDPVITESAGLTSPYDQLWSLSARALDPQLEHLRDVLAGPAAPTWVVVRGPETLATLRAQSAGTVLASRYHQVALMCDRIVFLHDGVRRSTPAAPAHCHTSAERARVTGPAR
jgi:hypothetical protein